MNITANIVKDLREKTGAGMMDCKRALVEANGDMDKAIEYLRKHGIAKAEKKSGRATKEGKVISLIKDGKAVLLEVLCETDFVATNEKFTNYINQVAERALALDGNGDVSEADCRVDSLDSVWPVLNRLVGAKVNLDELDYLAKRLNSFDVGEFSQFQAMAEKLHLTGMKNLINLTFCCQQATVITDFTNLKEIGRDHYMNIHGGCASMEELEQLDGEETAILLIELHEHPRRLRKHGRIGAVGRRGNRHSAD